MTTNVVVGYVPTPEGAAAVDAAIQEARVRQATLVVVNGSRGGAVIDTHLADGEALDRIERAAAEVDVRVEIHQSGDSDPVDLLLARSSSSTTALLVLGLRRRSRVGKLILGSTAQRLLLDAECPVLAVKAR